MSECRTRGGASAHQRQQPYAMPRARHFVTAPRIVRKKGLQVGTRGNEVMADAVHGLEPWSQGAQSMPGPYRRDSGSRVRACPRQARARFSQGLIANVSMSATMPMKLKA